MFWRKQQINALQGLARPTQAYLDSLVGPRGEELEAGKGALTLAFPRLDKVNNLGIGHLGVGGVGFGDGVAGGGHGNSFLLSRRQCNGHFAWIECKWRKLCVI